MSVCITESPCCTPESNTINQLYFNKIFKKNKLCMICLLLLDHKFRETRQGWTTGPCIPGMVLVYTCCLSGAGYAGIQKILTPFPLRKGIVIRNTGTCAQPRDCFGQWSTIECDVSNALRETSFFTFLPCALVTQHERNMLRHLLIHWEHADLWRLITVWSLEPSPANPQPEADIFHSTYTHLSKKHKWLLL